MKKTCSSGFSSVRACCIACGQRAPSESHHLAIALQAVLDRVHALSLKRRGERGEGDLELRLYLVFELLQRLHARTTSSVTLEREVRVPRG